jgi:DNA-directed RNA polymerase specialized sigma24 family protein
MLVDHLVAPPGSSIWFPAAVVDAARRVHRLLDRALQTASLQHDEVFCATFQPLADYLTLRYLHGWTLQAIAASWGVSRRTLGRRVGRCGDDLVWGFLAARFARKGGAS